MRGILNRLVGKGRIPGPLNFSLISFNIDDRRACSQRSRRRVPPLRLSASSSFSQDLILTASQPLSLSASQARHRFAGRCYSIAGARWHATQTHLFSTVLAAAQPLSPSASQARRRFAGRCDSIAGGSQACSRFGTLPQHCVFARHLSMHVCMLQNALLSSFAQPLSLSASQACRRFAGRLQHRGRLASLR